MEENTMTADERGVIRGLIEAVKIIKATLELFGTRFGELADRIDRIEAKVAAQDGGEK